MSPLAWALDLSETDAAAGMRAALEKGAGFGGRPARPRRRLSRQPEGAHPLPGFLEDAAMLLRKTGQGKRVDELVTAMNRAAEAAVPEANRC